MRSANRWLVLAIVSSALFLIVIDMTVLYTALPRLTHDLGATAAQKLWIVNAYPLVVAGLLPGLGTLGDRLGHKHLFVAGLIVFGIASLAAAYAPSPAALIGARGLLAVGAAMMMPATLSIIRLTFTDEAERAFAIGVWAAVASGGAALGPVIGGVLLEFFWWGSVFLINVPVVLVALVLAVRRVPGGRGRGRGPWDLLSSVQVMAGLVGLAYAVKELSRPEPAHGAAIAAALVGVAALTLFVRRQRRLDHPLIEFALFRNRLFSSGVAGALVASVALIGVELVLTQRFQLVAGLTPLQAGLLILPIPLAAFAAGPLAGLLLPRVGAGRVLSASILLAGLGLAFYLAVLDGPLVAQIAALAMLGAGLGAAMTAASTAIMTNAPEARAGMAASVEEVSYELGGAIGIAILGSVLSAVYTATLAVPAGLAAPSMVHDSLDQVLIVAESLPEPMAAALVAAARAAFDQGVQVVLAAATFILFATAAGLALANRAAARRPARAGASA